MNGARVWVRAVAVLGLAIFGPALTCLAQSLCYTQWTGNSGAVFGDPSSACQSFTRPGVTYSLGAQQSPGLYYCSGTEDSSGNVYPQAGQTSSPGTPCANCPSNGPNIDAITAAGQNTTPGAGSMCVGGCQYTSGAAIISIGPGSGSGGAQLNGKAVPLGSACGAGQPNASPGNCVSGSGVTACYQDSTSTPVVNGDAVPSPASLSSGSCTSYASGGVACVVPATGTLSGAPTSLVGGVVTPDTPAGTIQTAAGTVNYYSASQVASSATPVSTSTSYIVPGQPGVAPGSSSQPASSASSASGSLSGGVDCSSPPVCSDSDPVNCGGLQQVWLFDCQHAAEADIASAIGDYGASLVGSSTVDVSSAVNETLVSVSGGATCPAPITINFYGKTLVMDFWQYLCQWASGMSYVILVCAYMASARVIFNGVVANR